jgi:hypothetical protein
MNSFVHILGIIGIHLDMEKTCWIRTLKYSALVVLRFEYSCILQGFILIDATERWRNLWEVGPSGMSVGHGNMRYFSGDTFQSAYKGSNKEQDRSYLSFFDWSYLRCECLLIQVTPQPHHDVSSVAALTRGKTNRAA